MPLQNNAEALTLRRLALERLHPLLFNLGSEWYFAPNSLARSWPNKTVTMCGRSCTWELGEKLKENLATASATATNYIKLSKCFWDMMFRRAT
jgi:hypothetical protein